MKARWMKLAALCVCALTLGDGKAIAAQEAVQPAPLLVKVIPPDSGPLVNINNASLDELQMLPGIGQRKAEAIMERRQKRPFARVDQLMEVKGIGRGIFKKLKPFVRISGPTTITAKVIVRKS